MRTACHDPCAARRCRWAALALAVPLAAWGTDDGQRRLGDRLSVALPAYVLGHELWRGDGAGAGQFTRSFVVTVGVAELLKRSTGIERPDHSNDQSFPSGHAARAFAAATYLHRRHGVEQAWPLYALALYVGHTRVQSGRHRWADVAGAAGVAALSSRWLVSPALPVPGPAAGGRGLQLQWTLALP